MAKKNFEYLKNIPAEVTNHGNGLKQVFMSNEELDSALTQIAFGKFLPGEVCEEHVHPTMDECFFFIRGTGIYVVDGEEIELKENTFLIIKAGLRHSLRATGTSDLEFVYWGVAV